MKMIWLFPTSFPSQTSRHAGRLRLMKCPGVREASAPAQELPLPPPSLWQASEDKSGRGLPAEALAKAGSG
jgi:hypothetical protein